MATPLQLVSNGVNSVADTVEVFFTAATNINGVVIDAFTASNTSTANASYKAYIVDAAGATIQPQRPFQVVVWDEIDLGLGIVNQIIPPGGTLRMETSAINSIYFTVSGKTV